MLFKSRFRICLAFTYLDESFVRDVLVLLIMGDGDVILFVNCCLEGSPCGGDVNKEVPSEEDQFSLDAKDSNVEDEVSGKRAMTFTFEELSVSTGNFRSDCLLGEGGFGKVYKGLIERINQVIYAYMYTFLDPIDSVCEMVVWYSRLLQSSNLIEMVLKELESSWWK